MGKVYFVRHGETFWNVENKICGATDIALTERGHQQAVETGKKIMDEGIQLAKEHFTDRYGNGESMMQLGQRIYNLLDDIRASEKTYLLVAHNGIARVVKSYFETMSTTNMLLSE